jgi:cleavage and polyadenylation specificity factor subunit 1
LREKLINLILEMFTAIYETDQSTAVSHSAFGHFLPGRGRQLVTVCLKTLRLYRFNPYARYIDNEDHEWKEGVKLECIYKVELLTPIKSISVARIPSKPEVDSLILVFDYGKVSTVYFDGVKFAIETISLHDFEDDELRDGFKTDEVEPKVCVDPLQRCAVTLVYGRHLAILPFTDSQMIRSYTIPLNRIDYKLTNVIDLVFLHGYYEPTLLIVYEPVQAVPGRLVIFYIFYNLFASLERLFVMILLAFWLFL